MSDETQAELLGLGNALLDVVAEVEEGFLARIGVEKGAMTMIGEARGEEIHRALEAQAELSGGAVANTLAALAGMGARTRFAGIVAQDGAGRRFRADLTAQGVEFVGAVRAQGPPTGRCLVMVTPDAQRSMATFLGAGATLTGGDLAPAAFAGVRIVYAEAYLWDAPQGRAAVCRAAQLAEKTGARFALNLSDPLCVARHRAGLRNFAQRKAAILIANQAEICAFHQTESFAEALDASRALDLDYTALTRSERGAVVFDRDGCFAIPARPVAQVLDTTGAGDLFAAGFLHRLLAGDDVRQAGQAGAAAAAVILGQFGARPGRAALQSLAGADQDLRSQTSPTE